MQIEYIIINEYLDRNSFITTKQAESMGISRHILSYMAKDKKIIRVKQGIYTKNTSIIDKYYLISLNTKKVIFSYETALYLNNYLEKEPKNINITVPQGYNVNRLKKKADNLIFHYENKENFENEKINVLTKENNKVNIYSLKKTLIDIYKRDKNLNLLKKISSKLNQKELKVINNFFKSNNINLTLTNNLK